MSNLRHTELSWKLLEHKYRYYILNSSTIDDYSYDLLEKEYDSLCIQLNIPQTVSDMVGFESSRHSCQLVMEKLGAPKKKRNKK